MSAEKSRDEILVDDRKLREEIQKKHNKSIEELYHEREKRLYDAIQLKVPDRVPVLFCGTYPACKFYGAPFSSVYYDAPVWKSALKRMLVDLEPDGWGNLTYGPGTALDLIDSNYNLHPGGKLPSDSPHQINEQEYMKEDEYDLFLRDPSDYIIRYWAPRVNNSMKVLANLPPLRDMGSNPLTIAEFFDSPEFEEFAAVMKKAGQEKKKWDKAVGNIDQELADIGFPKDPFWKMGGGVMPPFSGFSNSFRGFKGVGIDMFRRPDKLKAALERFLEFRISQAKPAVHNDDKPVMGSAGESHRVSEEFLSKKQFEEFVWPYWKRAIEKTFELGYDVNRMFFEGKRDSQLEYFTEIPKEKGTHYIRFQEIDMVRAKSILGDRACLAGDVPVSLLCTGSPSEVEEYCKKLIQSCAKDGGFILTTSTTGYGETKPENIKAMIDSAEKYGRF
ncbi:MAG: hypothetical protein JW712_12275 [Dehalococcoidales bacterium]|nr:hypothetical protein [Dehalococcoidales bacterium]